jgi:hypothetical protein
MEDLLHNCPEYKNVPVFPKTTEIEIETELKNSLDVFVPKILQGKTLHQAFQTTPPDK